MRNSVTLLLLLLFIPTWSIAGTAYYVDPDASGDGNGSFGNPWNNVSQINAHTFSTGDDLYFKVNTTLEMTGRINLRWDGTELDRVIIGAYHENGQFGLRSGDKRPILRGSYFRDPNGPHVPSGNHDGLLHYAQEGTGYITIQDLELKESYTAGINLNNGKTKKAGSHLNKIIIRNNVIKDAGGYGISLTAVSNSIIENNFVDGVCTRKGRNPLKPKKTSGAAIGLHGKNKTYLSVHNVIRNNTIRRSFEGIGIYMGPTYTDVVNNIVYEWTDMAIYYANAQYGTISGNIIYNTSKVWWPDYQKTDKGAQNGIQIDAEDHPDNIIKIAGKVHVHNNFIANAKRGIVLGMRASRRPDVKGEAHTNTRVFNNRLVDSKIANIALAKGSKDKMADVEASWKENLIYDNYSFIYAGVGKHASNPTWPGVSWDGNYFNSNVDGDAAFNAKINEVQLKKKTGWGNLVPGSLKASDFDFTNEIGTLKPKKVANFKKL